MMEELAVMMKKHHPEVKFDGTRRRIGWLAHIINLATQALITAQSKSPHYDPKKPDAHLPDITAAVRDEVGLVRAISVKVLCGAFLFLD